MDTEEDSKAILTKKEKDPIDVVAAADVAFNFGDWNAFRDSCTEDISYEEIGTGRKVNGIENFLDVTRGAWKVAFPNVTCKFSNELKVDHMGENATVIVELVWSGTHKGPLTLGPSAAIPATGKSINVEAIQICEVVEGKIKSMRHYLDISTMMKQLGAEIEIKEETKEMGTKEAPARLETKRAVAQ